MQAGIRQCNAGKALALAILAALCIAGCARGKTCRDTSQTAGTVTMPQFAVSGRVVDADEGTGLDGVGLVFVDKWVNPGNVEFPLPRDVCTSNPDGWFEEEFQMGARTFLNLLSLGLTAKTEAAPETSLEKEAEGTLDIALDEIERVDSSCDGAESLTGAEVVRSEKTFEFRLSKGGYQTEFILVRAVDIERVPEGFRVDLGDVRLKRE